MCKWPLESSHLKNWIFKNENDILKKRQNAHRQAAERFLQKYPNAIIPSLEDSLRLIRYLVYQLNRLCVEKLIRPVIKETACYFFNRFFLNRSLIDFDPRIILFTCMTLAIKAEDYGRRYSFNELYGNMQELDTQVLLEMELPVCDALDFNLLILHTREPLLYLRNKCFDKLKENLKAEGDQVKEIQVIIWRNVWFKAEALCSTMQETDIPLLYTPAQMALAAFLHYGRTQLNQLTNIDLLIKEIIYEDEDKESWGAIKKKVDDITEMLCGFFSNRRYAEREEVLEFGALIQSIDENIWSKVNVDAESKSDKHDNDFLAENKISNPKKDKVNIRKKPQEESCNSGEGRELKKPKIECTNQGLSGDKDASIG